MPEYTATEPPSLPIRVPADFRIIAHRGASAYAPENTAAAFRLAHEMGVQEVELDAQLSTDGEVVLCHDKELTRYGHRPAVVEEMAWTELSRLDMGSWFSPYLYGGERMLRLDDLFAAYGDRFIYHVELKGAAAGLAAAVHERMNRYGLREACIITSFAYEALTAMRKIDATIPMGWLVPRVDNEVLEQARELGFFQVCPQAAHITAPEVVQARSYVQQVRAWGVAGRRDEVIAHLQRILDAGCDGTTLDWPDWLSV